MCRRRPPPPTCLSDHWSVPWRMGEVYGCRGELVDFACQRYKSQLGSAQNWVSIRSQSEIKTGEVMLDLCLNAAEHKTCSISL